MKFLIDAHLPPALRRVFAAAGHDAIHRDTRQMFETHLPAIATALQTNTLVEIDRQQLSIIA
ncbi:MAG: hypothetical protein IAE77_21135 [Prosthecobacter sp.]|jgi:predicted nuclease of predicted toxin-antitoxin system|uniref:hypothetical protein n=1 Tax=Prosthecobacter sp. TaxID=1965333 RepID=UPI0019DC4D42|nr:hypothetical protein [Prosthecobacter sp.]MBE2285975.1 hypothetical protein [Prosthecobacter sp.]